MQVTGGENLKVGGQNGKSLWDKKEIGEIFLTPKKRNQKNGCRRRERGLRVESNQDLGFFLHLNPKQQKKEGYSRQAMFKRGKDPGREKI